MSFKCVNRWLFQACDTKGNHCELNVVQEVRNISSLVLLLHLSPVVFVTFQGCYHDHWSIHTHTPPHVMDIKVEGCCGPESGGALTAEQTELREPGHLTWCQFRTQRVLVSSFTVMFHLSQWCTYEACVSCSTFIITVGLCFVSYVHVLCNLTVTHWKLYTVDRSNKNKT